MTNSPENNKFASPLEQQLVKAYRNARITSNGEECDTHATQANTFIKKLNKLLSLQLDTDAKLNLVLKSGENETVVDLQSLIDHVK